MSKSLTVLLALGLLACSIDGAQAAKPKKHKKHHKAVATTVAPATGYHAPVKHHTGGAVKTPAK